MAEPVVPRLFQGTRDVFPEELLARNAIQASLVTIFERYGFAPLETPAMEHLDILLGKYGPEGEKLIYKLAYKGGEVLALRYDLTVPFSRVMAMNRELPLPFKRWQIQPVWRADRPQPQQGRFREFIQCDVDTVGSESMAADAENVAVVHDGILACGIEDFRVKINHRRLLRGIILSAGIAATAEADVLRCVDKLDKIGLAGVRDELLALGMPATQTDRVLAIMDIEGDPSEVMAEAKRRLGDQEDAAVGLSELEELFRAAMALGVPTKRLQLDLHLTRGLDYYTGPVYEVVLTNTDTSGSLGGGGLSTDPMGISGGNPLPATGVSIGLSRVLAALQKLGKLDSRPTPSEIFLTRMADVSLEALLQTGTALRAQGIAVETHYDSEKMKKLFERAERKKIPVLGILGGSEIAAGTVTLKHLGSGQQVTAVVASARETLASLLRSPTRPAGA